MHTGMLWFDNDPRTALSVKIQKAVDYYKAKFYRVPNLCLVHPNMLENNQESIRLGTLVVRPYRPVLSGHLWIGISDEG